MQLLSPEMKPQSPNYPGWPKLGVTSLLLSVQPSGPLWPTFTVGTVPQFAVPLLVSRLLAGDDRYVMSCPVTFLVAARGWPSKTSYFSGHNRHHKFLKPKTSYYRGRTVLYVKAPVLMCVVLLHMLVSACADQL